MDDQASVRGDRSGGANGRAEGVVGSLADFANDVATLAELQAKLTAVDLREASQRAAVPLALLLAGVALLVGCIPVAVAGVALLVAAVLGISLGLSLLLTALALMIVAAVVAAYAARRLGRSLEVLRRSQEEFQRNLAWIRTVLVYSGRSVPRRRW